MAGLIDKFLLDVNRERGLLQELRISAVAQQLAGGQDTLRQDLYAIGKEGNIDTILRAEGMLLQNDLDNFTNSSAMKSSLETAVMELQVAVKFVEKVRDPERYKSTNEDHIHTRMSGVSIECLNYDAFIKRYDRGGTLFYLDPPYWGCEDYYGKDLFNRDDFYTLAEVLSGIKGKFILSLNDNAGVRECFGKFRFMEVTTRYTVTAGKSVPARELLISNYDLKQEG